MLKATQKLFLLRHGESQANASGNHNILDPGLTPKGRKQASSWNGNTAQFSLDRVLVSPLTRATETACLAFAGERSDMKMCREAREGVFDSMENELSSLDAMRMNLFKLPGGTEIQGLDKAFSDTGAPKTFSDSIQQLKQKLHDAFQEQHVQNVLVVCHYCVIEKLCGAKTENAHIVECVNGKHGTLEVVAIHPPPTVPAHLPKQQTGYVWQNKTNYGNKHDKKWNDYPEHIRRILDTWFDEGAKGEARFDLPDSCGRIIAYKVVMSPRGMCQERVQDPRRRRNVRVIKTRKWRNKTNYGNKHDKKWNDYPNHIACVLDKWCDDGANGEARFELPHPSGKIISYKVFMSPRGMRQERVDDCRCWRRVRCV